MISGKNLIDGNWETSSTTVPSPDIPVDFHQASSEQVDQACLAARRDFRAYAQKTRTERAAFLRKAADEIEALGAEITKTAMAESGLPEARLEGERGRTTGQLRLFADLIENTDFLDIRKDEALPDRAPLPRPDLRLTHRPIGPVVVFGASNFPLAFSTAGGDTASALAAGCPVIVKGHPAHAGTAELVAQAISKAVNECDMPPATFQILQGVGIDLGSALVQHEAINAVGFTGSLRGGRALYDLCHSRTKPIPFYGELGSINPVFLLPDALSSRASDLGAAWIASLTMGAGQFCTNPGVVIALKGADLETFTASALEALTGSGAQKMLTDGIENAYHAGVKSLDALIEEIGQCGQADAARHALPAVFKTDAKTWAAHPDLQHEVFGPSGIIIACDGVDDMRALAEALEGQLTATLHLNETDHALASELAVILEEKAGRLLCNGWPTGVEVCSAMMHGGPYPASTDVRSTSVGTLAISRWLRPVSYQNFPQELLHEELKG